MNEPNIIDLDLSVVSKKKFRIDGDDSRILELNVSDMNIISRLNDAYPKLQAQQEKASKLMDGIDINNDDDKEGIKLMSERLKEVDTDMRSLIDFIFDAPVSSVTTPSGSMYDPFGGKFRFEHLIAALMNQYEENLKSEYTKMEQEINKHTTKYVPRNEI